MVVFTDEQVGTMVEEICGEAVRSNFEDVECGPDPMHPSDKERSSDEDEDSSDDDEIEELYVDLAPPARTRLQDVERMEVVLSIQLRQLEHECRITGVPLATSVVCRQYH